MTSTNVASSMSPNRKLTTKGLSPSSLEFSPKGTDKKAMKSTMTATLQRHEYPEMYRGAIDSLQVPLRVPLDLSYSQGNRKLANVIFKSECVQKVKEASIKRDMDIEHTKAQIIAKTAKNEKRYAKELKERDTMLKQKNEEWEVKRNMVVNNKKKIA